MVLNEKKSHVSRHPQNVTGCRGPDNFLSVMEGGIKAMAVFLANV